MKLLLGTTNQAKIEDYKKYLRHANLKLLTLKDIGFMDEPLEIGDTYLENALQKARFYAEKTEYPTLADDGGLEIDALDGRPGVESKRWLGPQSTEDDIINKTLELLKAVPADKRTAKLRNVIVVYFPHEGEYLTVEGEIQGIIPERASPKKQPGFPYRPLFFLPQFKKYYAELDEDEHEKINHRRAACTELLMKLEPYVNS